jgi:CheY-like chemotaxis protein
LLTARVVSPRLLIVDDEKPLCWAMERFFSAVGYAVESTTELREAMGLLGAREFDLVISDLRMSGLAFEEGLALADFIRCHVPATRMVMLTAHCTPELEKRARGRGVDLVLSKPQPLPELARHVSHLLRPSP